MDLGDYLTLALGVFFVILIMCIFTFALSKTGYLKSETDGKLDKRNCAVLILVFGLLAIMATNYFALVYVNGLKIHMRDFVALAAGLVGGPVVGLGAGLIGGLDRYLLGGVTAIPCGVGTVLSGLIGGAVWYFGGKRYPKIWIAAVTMIAAESLHILLAYFFSDPVSAGREIVPTVALPLLIVNTVGIIAFSWVYRRYIDDDRD